jgi:hypothetical protein
LALRIQIGTYRLDKRRGDLIKRLRDNPPATPDPLYDSALRMLEVDYETAGITERPRLMSVAERNVSLYFTLTRMRIPGEASD